MNYKEERRFKYESIREMCIRHNFYTCGDNEAYDALLRKESFRPTVRVIEGIARDILRHSDDAVRINYTVEAMMYTIANECVELSYVRK